MNVRSGQVPSFPLHVVVQYILGMLQTDKRKQSLYFPEEMLREIQEAALRQDRSLSWVVQQAWKIARERVMKMPSAMGTGGSPGTPSSIP